MSIRFEYGVARIKDLVVRPESHRPGSKAGPREVLLDGRPVHTSNRFWTSLHQRFGFTANIFRYFSPAEVFARISEAAPNDRFRWCLEQGAGGQARLLAVTNPSAAVMRHDDLVELLGRYDATEVRYAEGVVSSRHQPRLCPTFEVGGDGFQNKFVLETPIDGYGRPAVYLSLLRLVCSNGAIGYAPAFRSELGVGKGDEGVVFALTRVLDGFNNEDGFAALRQRFEAATRSWASVHEANRLYNLLARLHGRKEVRGRRAARSLREPPDAMNKAARSLREPPDAMTEAVVNAAGGDGASESSSPLFAAFHKLTGDLSQTYGLANLDALSVKRQRTLPAACRVYDLLNFASEVATHHATEVGGRAVQAFIGELISGEYDLEGTVDQFADWRDFFIGSEQTADTLAALNRRSR